MGLAVVTGAGGGIGSATARKLAERGFSLALLYRKSAPPALPNSKAIQVDLEDHASLAAAFKAIDELGTPAALVSCHGITQDTLLGASTPDDFSKVMAANFDATVNVCRLASQRMLSARKGSIVLVSSVAAFRPGRGQSNYAASKGAIESFARALAVELAARNVRVNAVAPGAVDTKMTETIQALGKDELLQRILMKRLGTPEEIANVIAFLAGDETSYVTGQVWSVDGGFKLG